MRHPLLHKKLKAGSLLATLIISLVVLASCLAFLLAAYYNRSSIIKDEIDQRLSDDMTSGITLIISGQDEQTLPDSLNGLLFDRLADSLEYKKEDWGCIPLAAVRVGYKGRNRSKAFFYGVTGFEKSDAILYVADNARPVSLTGGAYVEGKVYLPRSGLIGHFFQHPGFSGKILIKGDIDTSNNHLPALRPSIRKFIRQLADIANNDAGAVFTNFLLNTKKAAKEINVLEDGKILPCTELQLGAFYYIFENGYNPCILKWLN